MLHNVASVLLNGLRSYKTEPQIWDGDEFCDHEWGATVPFAKQDTRTVEQKIAQGATVGSNQQFNDENTAGNSGCFCRCGAWRGELGLEPTFQLYLSHLLQIFTEVKRVVKADGTIFVNLGDSYEGSGRGPTGVNGIGNQAKRQGFAAASDVLGGRACDTAGRELLGSQASGLLSRNPDDEHTTCPPPHTSDIDGHPVQELVVEFLEKIRGCMALHFDRSPIGDLIRPQQTRQSLLAIRDCLRTVYHDVEQIPSFLESTPAESFQPPQGELILTSNGVFDLAAAPAFFGLVRECADRLDVYLDSLDGTADSALLSVELLHHIQYIFACCLRFAWDGKSSESPYLQGNYSTNLSPKSLMNIPHRFFIMLTDELGLIQRNNINWWKRACMPSSAKDRFTVDFESIGFFTKSARYKFNQILEPLAEISIQRVNQPNYENQNGSIGNGGAKTNGMMKAVLGSTDGRNCRTTWDFGFEPQSNEHYAAYPSKMCDRMILAGSDEGDTVLDIFSGTASTGLSALRLKRNFCGVELNPDYIKIAEKRLAEVQVKLFA